MRSRSQFGHAGRFSLPTFNAAHVGWWSPTPPFIPQFGSCRRISIQRGSFSSPVHNTFQSVVNVQRAETTNICVLHCIHLFLLYRTIRYTAAKLMLSQRPLLKSLKLRPLRPRCSVSAFHTTPLTVKVNKSEEGEEAGAQRYLRLVKSNIEQMLYSLL